jgi:DNA-binding XRE family transcriptional regulator
MKKIGNLKFYTLEEMLEKSLRSKTFRKAYEEELARVKLVRQIRETRIAKKLTQKEVAKKTDMPQSVIARIESGRHSFSLATLYRIARVFGKEIQIA